MHPKKKNPDLESVMAYADALSNDGGGRFQRDLYDYLQILNTAPREFRDEFSQRARDLYNDHFYRTAESASRDVTPESKRDASGIDRERVNKFYRDLFQSALSEDGYLAEVILDQANRREQRLLKNAVNKEISAFKNSPEGKEAAQMAGPMMSLINEYGKGGMVKGGTVKYRSGGVMKYDNGGPIDQAGESEVKVMVKDSYNTATNPQPGQDYIILVEGQPTDYAISDMPNFFRSEGLGGPQLENVFYEFMDQFPKGPRTAEEEQAYRKSQFDKALADVAALSRGDGYAVQTVTPGAFSRDELGNVLRGVSRGDKAGEIEYSGRYSPTGQTKTPKGINTDDFLRVLATQFNR